MIMNVTVNRLFSSITLQLFQLLSYMALPSEIQYDKMQDTLNPLREVQGHSQTTIDPSSSQFA
jgi:hypothetical protein